MAEAKTKPTSLSVKDFIAGVGHEGRREDAQVMLKLMEKATGWKARMWGPSIIGFGRYDYTYESGHSGSAPVTGFSPRKANMVAYIGNGFDAYEALLARLGKHSIGKSCLYLGRLSAVDMGVLEQMVRQSVVAMKARWPVSAE